MKTWNPFAIFQYITGSIALHLAMTSLLLYHGKITRGKLGDNTEFDD